MDPQLVITATFKGNFLSAANSFRPNHFSSTAVWVWCVWAEMSTQSVFLLDLYLYEKEKS